MSRILAILMVAFLAIFAAAPAGATETENEEVDVGAACVVLNFGDDFSVRTASGGLARIDIPDKYQGWDVAAAGAEGSNNHSVHVGNGIVITSDGGEGAIRIDNVEGDPEGELPVGVVSGSITSLGTNLVATLELGSPDGIFSGGFVAWVKLCEPPAPPVDTTCELGVDFVVEDNDETATFKLVHPNAGDDIVWTIDDGPVEDGFSDNYRTLTVEKSWFDVGNHVVTVTAPFVVDAEVVGELSCEEGFKVDPPAPAANPVCSGLDVSGAGVVTITPVIAGGTVEDLEKPVWAINGVVDANQTNFLAQVDVSAFTVDQTITATFTATVIETGEQVTCSTELRGTMPVPPSDPEPEPAPKSEPFTNTGGVHEGRAPFSIIISWLVVGVIGTVALSVCFRRV